MTSRIRNTQVTNGVRHRNFRTADNAVNELSKKTSEKKGKFSPSAIPYVFIVLILYSAIFYLQFYLEHRYFPPPKSLRDSSSNVYVAERTMNRLQKLTALGPRVAGSHANEVEAVEFLLSEINKIKESAHKGVHIDVDVQRVSGSYNLEFLDGLTNVYRNVANVVVRVSSQENWKHSLLLNCHFDSVPDSPGASDDGAGCATLLEIMQVITSSSEPLRHNIIFLFNGAEENLMHASHGFITQHKWAKEVRAFVNLEACGAGGREILFQSGPNSPWIMKTYADTVPRPFASSMAQEIFESGIVPGETDFRVFRDYGNISGLDFAWSANGYVYHTFLDDIHQIPLGALQGTGSNILALVRGLANAEQLSDPVRYRPGNLVYFDFLGIIVIHWSEEMGNFLNLAAVFLSITMVYLNKRTYESNKGSDCNYFKSLKGAFKIVILGSFLCTIFSLIISGYLTLIGRTMSWYGNPFWLFLLYVVPCLTTIMALQYAASKEQIKMLPISRPLLLVQIYCDVYQLLWTLVLSVAIYFRIRSACLAWLWVIGPLTASMLLRAFYTPYSEPRWRWLGIFLAGLICPVIQYIGMEVGVLSLFIPIMGRIGAGLNSEIIMGLFCTYTCAMLFSYASPLIFLERKPARVLKILSGIFLVSVIVVSCTNLGFPYSGDKVSPRPQRYMILHTERVFHQRDGKVSNREGGFWFIDHDWNSPHAVRPYVPDIEKAVLVSDCDRYLFCAMPYLMPVLGFIWKTHWLPAEVPEFPTPTSMEVLLKSYFPDRKVVRISLRLTGPDHMSLSFSPRNNNSFAGWSVSEQAPMKGLPWNGRDTYFVYYACSVDCSPWELHIDFHAKSLRDPVADISLSGHFLHGPHQRTPGLRHLIRQFPSWAVVTSWSASHHVYVV